MKVVQINAVYNIGSTGRTTRELEEALIEAGHTSYVAYAQTNVDAPSDSHQIGCNTDWKVHSFLSRLTGKQGYFSYSSTKKLLGYLDEIRPDVVHLRNLHANYVNVPMLLKYLAEKDIATVITLHDFWFITGNCVYPNIENCTNWQRSCGNCPNINNGNRSWFFDKTSVMMKDKIKLLNAIPRLAITGVSDWVAGKAKMSPVAKNAIVKRIYNWIDFDKFYPRDVEELKKKENPDNKFTVLGVALIWDDKKGLKSFVELAEQKKDFNFVLIGNVPAATEFPSNIHFVGPVSSVDKLAEYYNMADVFVTFSKAETFGKVSAEAMSCGTPVICYNTTACPEILGDNCGYAVEIDDVQGVVSALDEIYKNGKSHYSDSCIKHARATFEKKMLTNEYIDLYSQLCEGK